MERRHAFVAINFITCTPSYRARFEELFATRAHAIDRMPGFVEMQVLRPKEENGTYLIVSHWESEEAFKHWTDSPEFLEGHRRGFADVAEARKKGEEPPMRSDFKVYDVLSR